jgi:hypothetical protein
LVFAGLVLLLLSSVKPAAADEPPNAAPPDIPALPADDPDKVEEDKELNASVALGLEWLAGHQEKDGHWSLEAFHKNHAKCTCRDVGGMKNDTAATALALLPFLGAGHTQKPPKDRSKADHSKVVKDGLTYLVDHQNKEGTFDDGMYAHGLATLALCRAYGMTQDPKLKPAAEKAIAYLVKAQHKGGGWRYKPGQEGDTSVTGLQVLALKEGQMAGLEVPKKTTLGVEKFLDSVMLDSGGFTYLPGETSATNGPTAIGVLSREFLGWTPKNPNLKKGIALIVKTPPGEGKSLYRDYFATMAVQTIGGDDWKDWNAKMRDHLLKKQDKGDDAKRAHQKGSWSPAGDEHGKTGGRILQTSLALMTLETNFRHLPLYRRANEKP